MNKIYLEPITKAENLMDGVKSQQDKLAKSGVIIDVQHIDMLCRSLEEAGRLQDEAEAALKVQREKAHACLDRLKEAYIEAKTPIKQNFPPESWALFGLMDKK